MKKNLTYAEKLQLCKKEALITVGVLVLLILLWLFFGFGLSSIDITILGTPLWVVCGTLGTWIAAIIAACVLARVFFDDVSFDEDENEAVANPVAPAASSAPSEERLP